MKLGHGGEQQPNQVELKHTRQAREAEGSCKRILADACAAAVDALNALGENPPGSRGSTQVSGWLFRAPNEKQLLSRSGDVSTEQVSGILKRTQQSASTRTPRRTCHHVWLGMNLASEANAFRFCCTR